MAFGQKLQLVRKQNGMSQEELADKLSVSRQSVSKWELEESFPDTKNIVQLSKLFKVTTDCLLNDDISLLQPINNIPEKDETIAQLTEKRSKPSSMMLAGCILAFLGCGSLLLFWILSIADPVIIKNVGTGEVYDRLIGYLMFYKAEWLFAFCCLVAVTGLAIIVYDIRKSKTAIKSGENKKIKMSSVMLTGCILVSIGCCSLLSLLLFFAYTAGTGAFIFCGLVAVTGLAVIVYDSRKRKIAIKSGKNKSEREKD